MKLIYAEGACSLAVHIMLVELGVPYEGIKVSLHERSVLESYNPRGYVPVLILNDGTVMTEAISILQYLSTTHSDAFIPKNLPERTKCIEWLAFISSELHKGMAPLFYPNKAGNEFLVMVKGKLHNRLQDMDEQLQNHAFLVGETYTIADMYAFAILRIIESVGISLDEFSGIQEYKSELEENLIIKKIIEKEMTASEVSSSEDFSYRSTGTEERPQPTL